MNMTTTMMVDVDMVVEPQSLKASEPTYFMEDRPPCDEDEEEEWEDHEGSIVSTSNSVDATDIETTPSPTPSPSPSPSPSPLGLRLKKTPSLLEFIQWSLSCQTTCNAVDESGNNSNQDEGTEPTKDANVNHVLAQDKDKKKATNFPALSLRIGEWERISRYEGDLVVKCYFAKRKLVWEVLEGGLKSKIEIQWSDVTALRASCPEDGPGTLEIQIAKPPMFSKESNPQPRKHTQWQPTSDFTGGQGTIYRRHVLKFTPGLLDKHYLKLIESDPRLNMLSKRGFNPSLESPYFHDMRFGSYRDQAEQCYRWSSGSEIMYKPTYFSSYDSLRSYGNSCLYDLTSLSRSFPSAAEDTLICNVPEFEHFDPEEILHNSSPGNSVSTSEDGFSPKSNRNRLEEIAEYLLDDSFMSDDQHSGIDTDDSMMAFQQHVTNGNLWFTLQASQYQI